MPRRDGQTLRDFLRAASDAGADFVMVTSWNEWPETTVVEPSSSWPDPYLYLRILAEWKGKEFHAPRSAASSNGRTTNELNSRDEAVDHACLLGVHTGPLDAGEASCYGLRQEGKFDFGGVVLGSLKQLTTQKWIYYVWQDNSPSRAETRLHLTPDRFHGVNPVGTHHQDP